MEIIKSTKLDNGLEIITADVKTSDFVTINYYVNVGSFDEKEDVLGIAHLTEHLLFKGTVNRTSKEIFYDIEKLGGNLNAYTSYDHTTYYATIPKEYWKNALDILSDMMWNCIIPESEFEQEKLVVIEELKMYNDDGKDRAVNLMSKTYFKKFKNRYNNGGTIDTVSKIKQNDVVEYIENFYIPKNIKILVTGNINHDEVVEYVKQYTDKYIFENKSIQYRANVLENDVNVADAEESMDTSQSHLIFYFSLNESDIKSICIFDMASYLFGTGFNSRLSEIRDKYGYAYTVCCDNDIFKDMSIFFGYVGLNKNNIEKTKEIIEKEILNICENGITDEELDRGKNHMRSKILQSFETTDNSNLFKINMIRLDLEYDSENILKILDNLTIQDINNFFKKYFGLDKIGYIEILQKNK